MLADIVLIGPPLTGKSTVGKLLAEKLNLPQCSLDALRWQYYKEAGYDNKLAQEAVDKDGLLGLLNYWKPFDRDLHSTRVSLTAGRGQNSLCPRFVTKA